MKKLMLICFLINHPLISMEMGDKQGNKHPSLERTESKVREELFATITDTLRGQIPDLIKLPDTDTTIIGTEKKPICYAGESEMLDAHIAKSKNPDYPFSVTYLFKYRKEPQENKSPKKIFTRIGDIYAFHKLDLKNIIFAQFKNDINNEIEKGNWLYVPRAKVQKTRFSEEEPVAVSALIVGTTDTRKVQSLRTLLDRELLKKSEKSKKERTP